LLKEKNLLIPAAAGSFSLDATSGLLATAGAIGADAILVLSAQPLWCELCDIKKKKKDVG